MQITCLGEVFFTVCQVNLPFAKRAATALNPCFIFPVFPFFFFPTSLLLISEPWKIMNVGALMPMFLFCLKWLPRILVLAYKRGWLWWKCEESCSNMHSPALWQVITQVSDQNSWGILYYNIVTCNDGMSPRLAFLFLLVGCYVSYVIRLKPISNLPCIFICFGQTLPLAGWLPAAFTNQSLFSVWPSYNRTANWYNITSSSNSTKSTCNTQMIWCVIVCVGDM